MKKLTIAAAIVIMALGGYQRASAEMVDIGTGQMERSEFIILKAMVHGQTIANHPAISTPLESKERYGMVEMSRKDFEALRNKVDNRSTSVAQAPAKQSVQMVNIGTGEMPVDEFMALKRMVEGKISSSFGHLAATRR